MISKSKYKKFFFQIQNRPFSNIEAICFLSYEIDTLFCSLDNNEIFFSMFKVHFVICSYGSLT